MKKFADIFNPYEMIKQNQSIPSPALDEKKNEDLVNEIYINLCAIFKGCWVSNNQEDINAYKKQLFLAFQQFKITSQEQIENGLFNARAENLEYFPSIKQVIDWCLDIIPEKAPIPQHLTMDWDGVKKWDDKPKDEKQRLRELGKANCRALLEKLRG
jgi:hypothetical protein